MRTTSLILSGLLLLHGAISTNIQSQGTDIHNFMINGQNSNFIWYQIDLVPQNIQTNNQPSSRILSASNSPTNSQTRSRPLTPIPNAPELSPMSDGSSEVSEFQLPPQDQNGGQLLSPARSIQQLTPCDLKFHQMQLQSPKRLDLHSDPKPRSISHMLSLEG